jgi:hypothetical protein
MQLVFPHCDAEMAGIRTLLNDGQARFYLGRFETRHKYEFASNQIRNHAISSG